MGQNIIITAERAVIPHMKRIAWLCFLAQIFFKISEILKNQSIRSAASIKEPVFNDDMSPFERAFD